MSYKEDIAIDPYALDKEWIQQSSFYEKYSTKHANAIADRDSLKEELEIVKSEVLVDIQKHWSSYGFTAKPTDSVAKAFVEQAEEVKKLKFDIIKASKTVNVFQAAKTALDHKKKALENLTTLWVQNWYSEPREGVLNKGYQEEVYKRKQQRSLKNNSRLYTANKKKESKND